MNLSKASAGAKLQDRVGYFLNLTSFGGYEREVSELVSELYQSNYDGWTNALMDKAFYKIINSSFT